MTVLALDVGDRRIGVAISDPTELLARPVATIVRRSNASDLAEIGRLALANQARLIVVGLPVASDDSLGEQGRRTKAFVRYLRKSQDIPVETWDERYSTLEAQQIMIAQGVRRERRRSQIDAAAAAVILDEWLTAQRSRAT